jgi:ABC-type molybdate transport system substrate-binding protein
MESEPVKAGKVGAPRVRLKRLLLPRRALLVTLAMIGTARAENGRTAIPDVAVFCDPTLVPALRRVAALFPAPIHILSTTPLGMLAQIERQTQTDVLISLRAAIDDGVTRKLVQPPTRKPLGSNQVVIARRYGDNPAPVAEDPAAVQALLATGRLAAPDPTAATTVDTPAILARLGVAALVQDRLDGTADTAEAADRVSDGRARFGLVYMTDVCADPRLTVAATVGAAASYDAVASYAAASPNTRPFLEFLHTGEAAARLRAAGLEVT